ncbi:small GTPase LIP1-like isoform X1 [Oryza brachyantha]|uniref:small GTPase LIP1-like isoform X1 n=1 Tax=Oryza brachyantha TaxID=4533 RepID=UPI000776AC69|nr:small GTPase LIP1-like isoform X1 [Oryza brachyantha]
MFWRDSGGRSSGGGGLEQNGVGPFGQVRVLVVGDSEKDQTILPVQLLQPKEHPEPEVNWHLSRARHHKCREILFGASHFKGFCYCSTSPDSGMYGWCERGSSNNIINDVQRNFFVELWDVSGHERYRECRSIFYTQINGVIFVYDLSQRKTKTNLNKWAVEVAETGTFSAPLRSGGPGGLPVPYLVIANKVDLVPRDGSKVSSGSLVDYARQWVEKQGLLPSSEELPLTESFPGSSGLLSAVKEARYDKEAMIKFFRMLIRRRFFSNEPAAPSPWSVTPREDSILPVETLKEEVDSFQRKSYSGEDFMYKGVTPLPAQRSLASPPDLSPQQPVFSLDNYRYHRYSSPSLPDVSSNRTSREDINV